MELKWQSALKYKKVTGKYEAGRRADPSGFLSEKTSPAFCNFTIDRKVWRKSRIDGTIPSLTVGGRKNGYTLDFIRAVAIFCFVTICAIFSLIPVLTVSFL